MDFYQLGSYKEQILKMIAADEDIMHFFSPDCCLDLPYIPGMVMEGQNLICTDSYIAKAGGRAITEVGVDIYVMFHKDNMSISDEVRNRYQEKGYRGNPIDIVVQALGRRLNGCKDFGIGSLRPNMEYPVRSYIPQEDTWEYYGKILSYTGSDFIKDFRKVI